MTGQPSFSYAGKLANPYGYLSNTMQPDLVGITQNINDLAQNLGIDSSSNNSDPADAASLTLPDGSVLTGNALSAYNQSLAAEPGNLGDARTAALGATLANQISTARASLVAQADSLDPDFFTKASTQLNVATDALLSTDAYYKNGISELLPAGVQRLSTDAALAPLGITTQQLQPDDKSDFVAGAYYDANRSTYVIADQGTASTGGAVTDLLQGVGLPTQQYSDAYEIAKDVKLSSAGIAGQVEYTGHSLGGGLAALQALIGNAPAVTFNAAGLNPIVASSFGASTSAPNQITTYNVSGQILGVAQSLPLLSSADGNRISLPAVNPVQITPTGLVHTAPLTGLQQLTNTIGLHKTGAILSSIYDNFPVFNVKP